MNLICAICQDSLEPSNDIFATPCGHAFHFPCLIQWLEKSQTCPECRQKVKRDKIIRIYFNFANTEVIREDSFTLQSKIDSLSFQIKLKETELNTSREENAKLKKQNNGLRDEVKNTEKTLNEKNSVIYALKEQSSYLKDKCQNYDKVVAEKKELQKKISTYDNVISLLNSTTDDVDNMLNKTTDHTTLVTYLSVMKRELHSCISKRKDLRDTVRRLQHDLQTVKMERNSITSDYEKKMELLEEELALCRSENDSLEKQLASISIAVNGEKDSKAPKDVKDVDAIQSVASRKRESSTKMETDIISTKKLKKAVERLDISLDKSNDSDVVFVSPNVKKTKENSENSPYLPTKSKSILTFKSQSMSRNGFSIKPKQLSLSLSKKPGALFKNPRDKDPSVQFDGFGGHSKVEVFPMPKSSPNKLKRPATDLSKNKKIKLDLGNKQIDDYVVNLT